VNVLPDRCFGLSKELTVLEFGGGTRDEEALGLEVIFLVE
jgi:hypothetical protein